VWGDEQAESRIADWVRFLSDFAAQYQARIISFIPRYKIDWKLLREKGATFEEARRKVAEAADARWKMLPRGLLVLYPLYTRDKSKEDLEQFLTWCAEYEPLHFLCQIPPEVGRKAIFGQLDIAEVPAPARELAAQHNKHNYFVPEISTAPKRGAIFLRLQPDVGFDVLYKGESMGGLSLGVYKESEAARQGGPELGQMLNYSRSYAEIEQTVGKERTQSYGIPKEFGESNVEVVITRPVMTFGELGETLDAACKTRITVDRCLKDVTAICITPGAYKIGELFSAMELAGQIAVRPLTNIVHLADRSWDYEKQAFYREHALRQLDWWRAAGWVFRNEIMRETAKPFDVESFLNQCAYRYTALTEEQRALVDWWLRKVGEEPTREQLSETVILLSPMIVIDWSGEGSRVPDWFAVRWYAGRLPLASEVDSPCDWIQRRAEE